MTTGLPLAPTASPGPGPRRGTARCGYPGRVPEDTTTIHLLRHGEVHNPEGVVYGRLPGYSLNEDGMVMAKAAAQAFTGRDLVALFSSPMERARETAHQFLDAFSLVPCIDDRLTEAGVHFEGQRFHLRGALRHPAHWMHLRNPFRPSWGEPYSQIASRMLAAVAIARDLARGREAVCVTHQLPIWVLRRAVERRPLWHLPDRRQCALASVTSLTYAGDRIVSVRYSEPVAGDGSAAGT